MFSSNRDESTLLQAKITDLEQQLCQCQMELQQIRGSQDGAEPILHEILEQTLNAIARVRIFDDYRIEYLYCSRGHEAVFGYTSEEFTRDSTLWLSRVEPEDRESAIFQTGFEHIFAEQSFTIEYRFYCKDGSLRWISSTFSSQRDDIADCWIATGSSTDITHCKKAETALHRSEAEFRLVAENIAEVLFVESADSDEVVYVSSAFEKIWQVPFETLYDHPTAWFEAIHPDDRELVLFDLTRRKQGECVEREFRVIRPNGEIRWLFSRSSPVFDEAGQLIRHVGIGEDITERKQAQQEIQFQANLLDQVRNAVICTDLDGNITYWNHFAETLYQWKAVEAIGQPLMDIIVPPEQKSVIAAGFERLRQTHHSEGERLLQRKDGTLLTVLFATTATWNEAGEITGFVGVSMDISDRKRAEEALREREQQLATLTANVPGGIYQAVYDASGNLTSLYLSDGFRELLGYEPQTLMNHAEGALSLIHPDDRVRFYEAVAVARETLEPSYLEYRLITASGESKWIRDHARFSWNENGDFIVNGIDIDISDRKQVEAALHQLNQELEQRIQERTRELEQSQAILWERKRSFKTLVENTPDIIARFDRRLRHLYVNPVIERVTGIPADQFVGKTNQDLGMPEHLATNWSDQLQSVFDSGRPRAFEFDFPSSDGLRHYQSKLVPEFAPDGAITSVLVISRDITDFKQAQDALYQSEQLFRAVFENAGVGIAVVFPPDFKLERTNRVLQQMLGYSAEELATLNYVELVHPDDRALGAAFEHQVGEQQSYSLERRLICKNGQILWVILSISLLWDANAQIRFGIGIVQDITSRKQAEEALRHSEQKHAILAETVPVGIFYADSRLNTSYVNSRWREMTGLTEADVQGLGWLQAIYPDDHDRLMASWHSAIQSNSPFQAEHRLIHRNGSIIWVFAQATPERDGSGLIIGYLGTVTDISDRKAVEEALRHSEELFRKLFEEAPIGIVLGRVSNYRLYKANQMFCQTFGYSAEELAELAYTDLTYPDDLAAELPLAEQMLMGSIPGYQLEKRYIKKSGEVFWGHVTSTVFRDSANQPIIALGMVQDITERKQAEAQLQHNEALLRQAQQIAQLGSWEFDAATQESIWSEEKFRIFGLDPAGLEPTYEQLLQQLIHPDDRDSFRQAVTRAIEQAEPYTLDLRIIQPDTTLRYVLAKGHPVVNSQGQVVKLIGTVMDISDRKQAEAALQRQAQREQLLRLITHRMRQTLDLDEILTTAVIEVRQTFGADRALVFRLLPEGRGQVIKESVLPEYPALGEGLWTDACLDPDSIKHYCIGQPRIVSDVALDEWGACLGQLLHQIGVRSKISAPIIQSLNGSTQIWGLLIVHACARYRQWLPEEARFLQQISNQLAIAIQQSNLYQQTQTELIERQQVENRLRASLQEKEVLLKEIHHRVKNNMQMISSLLNLQADSIQDPEALQPFIESQRRVKTMALIHEKLYQSHNLAQINFAEYVQQLAHELLQSFQATYSRIHVAVEVTDVNLTVDTAIPCGLIINELVTNALKYAFPQGQTGEIHIRFLPDPASSLPDNPCYLLSVKDNGIGIPNQIDIFNTDSLGLQIICMFTQKLKGTISLNRMNGTEFNIVVPLPDKIYKS